MTRAVWFELYVTDIDDARRFYGAVFDWQLEGFEGYDPENYFLLRDADGSAVGGAIVGRESVPELETSVGAQVVVYLEVADLDETLERVRAAGGGVVIQRRRIGRDDGFFAVVTDPEGTVIGLWSAG